MAKLHRDYETRSYADLKKVGLHAYMAHPTTSVWCGSYAVDDGTVKLWLPGQPVPDEYIDAFVNEYEVWAHNDQFDATVEAAILEPRYSFPRFDLKQHRCSMVGAYAMALPGALEDLAPALGIDARKDAAGKRLMLQLSKPRKVVFAAGFSDIGYDAVRTQEMDADGWEHYATATGRLIAKVQWWNSADKLARLHAYALQDTEVERAAGARLRPLKESELALWHLDQKVNDRGVFVDVALCNAAKKIVAATAVKLDDEMRAVTGGEVGACSNVGQLIAFARERGVDTDSIAKDILEELLAKDDLDPTVRRALELRREAAKASVAKIDALLKGKSPDGRARGLLQFLAASTGRWAGRRFQPQNLKRPILDDIDSAIDAVMEGDADLIEMIYGAPLSVVGDCLRGMIAAAPGRKIVAADYANIEGRVLAWLAGERWKLDAFRAYDAGTGPDLYKVTAGLILGKRPEDVTKAERQGQGKVPELACGFQGSVGAFQSMAVIYGFHVPDDEALGIVKTWRGRHPRTRQFWYDIENAAIAAVQEPGTTTSVGMLRFKKAGSFLFMRLPSGRFLTYPYPEIRPKLMPWKTDDGGEVWKDALTYFSTIDVSKRFKIVEDPLNTSKWARIATYGGMLAENATQAVARDVLADAMPRVEAGGYPVILTVHDEIVTEPEAGFGSAEGLVEIMTTLPAWADGCPIQAEGFEAERYRK